MKKVILLMSGGIDSSVSALLLKNQGYKVIGLFLELSDNKNFKEGKERAKKIAKFLNIDLKVINYKKQFEEKIIKNFLLELKRGFTPNPCVICNPKIKFDLALKLAKKFKADFIASGHYARIHLVRFYPKAISKLSENQNNFYYALQQAKDKEKDQSYFLWKLTQKELKKIIFPLGNYTRKEVENIAKKFKLPILDAKKSLEICFIQKSFVDFLKRYLKENPGNIVDTERKILGKHKGLWFYTIGQRKGINLPLGPYWVLDKNFKKNVLIVTKNEKDLYKKFLYCKKVNFILGKEPNLPLKIKAKIRYKSNLTDAILEKEDRREKVYKVTFLKPQRAITPGQSVVFYKNNEVLGGGIIFL